MDFILEGIITGVGLLLSGHEETFAAVRVTVLLSSLAIAASLALGIPLGFALGMSSFPGKRAVRTLVDTLLAFPTVVIGLIVYALLTRRGPLGELDLLFTIPGMALGEMLLGLPIIIALTATTIESMDERLRLTLLTLGAGRTRAALTTLWEARFGVMLAGLAAYGRIVSEVGIAMMVGGNVKWHTRTITTAIALETGKGQFAMGVALGLVLLTIALVVNILASALRQRSGS